MTNSINSNSGELYIKNAAQVISENHFVPTNTASTVSGNYAKSSEDDMQSFEGLDDTAPSSTSSSGANYDLASLEAKKAELTNAKAEAANNINEINSGTSPDIANAKEEMDKAYARYNKALSNDAEDEPAIQNLKTKEEDVKNKIEEKDNQINEATNKIVSKRSELSEQKNTVATFESELSSLEGQLSSLPKKSNKKGSEEQNAQIDAQKAQLEKLISLKKEQAQLAKEKLERFQEELDSLKEEKDTLKTEKLNLKQEEKSIQNEIKETASKVTKERQEAYNEAKESYTTQKNEAKKAAREEIKRIEAELSEVEKLITECKNNERQNGNLQITGQDVISLATQYEGLNNDQMKAIMQNEGARFDDGQWCSDFVTHMMKKTYGADNTPGDFANTCSLFCNCQAVADWGATRGLNTKDVNEVQAGDAIIVRTDSGSLHIGYVASINPDGTINTIEGNTAGDDGVYKNNGEVNKRKRGQEEVYTFVKFRKEA